MCGRIVQKTNLGLMAINLGLDESIEFQGPRYNLAPASNVLVVRSAPTPGFAYLHWGLIPSWSKDKKIGFKMSNARAETLQEKPSYREAFKSRRCLIPVDGFFEWKSENKIKQPYLIQQSDGEVFFLAGIWERWSSKEGEVIESCSILTTAAKGNVQEIHDRMPVIIPRQLHQRWLSKDADPQLLELADHVLPNLKFVKVSPRMNSSRTDDAQCIEPLIAA